jgi:hypothetical protein
VHIDEVVVDFKLNLIRSFIKSWHGTSSDKTAQNVIGRYLCSVLVHISSLNAARKTEVGGGGGRVAFMWFQSFVSGW